MAYYLSEINERCRKDPVSFIAECDAIYQQRLEEAAERILASYERSPIVLLSGPSGSGKTTTARKISEILSRRGMRTHYISMDDYFKSVSPLTTPRLPDGGYDLESPLCMDMELLNDHFTRLSRGEQVWIPKYSFTRQMRDTGAGHALQLRDGEIAIFEGIHALNDMITDTHPEAFKLYISARSVVEDDNGEVIFKGTWMRLMRRVVRDNLYRGTDAAETLQRWASVRRGEKLYISPFKDKANFQFDTSLPYELAVFNRTATELFRSVPEGIERFDELRQVLPALQLFGDIDEKYVAKESLIREFIGGGIYEY